MTLQRGAVEGAGEGLEGLDHERGARPPPQAERAGGAGGGLEDGGSRIVPKVASGVIRPPAAGAAQTSAV